MTILTYVKFSFKSVNSYLVSHSLANDLRVFSITFNSLIMKTLLTIFETGKKFLGKKTTKQNRQFI